MYAIVRDLPSTFDQCVTSADNSKDPIDVELAKKQHADYVNVIKQHVNHVVEVETDDSHPDCCFVEDTAVVVKDTAIITYIGTKSRRGEEEAIENELKKIPSIQRIAHMHSMDPEATLDGGDVLYTGKHIFVGLSDRTNERGAECLVKVFSDICPVYVMYSLLNDDTLHFKSLTSFLNDHTLLIADHHFGQLVMNEIKSYTDNHYEFIMIPGQVSSNILSLNNGQFVIYQDNYPQSEQVILEEIRDKRGVKVMPLCMSELIKADGALTCCSILI